MWLTQKKSSSWGQEARSSLSFQPVFPDSLVLLITKVYLLYSVFNLVAAQDQTPITPVPLFHGRHPGSGLWVASPGALGTPTFLLRLGPMRRGRPGMSWRSHCGSGLLQNSSPSLPGLHFSNLWDPDPFQRNQTEPQGQPLLRAHRKPRAQWF